MICKMQKVVQPMVDAITLCLNLQYQVSSLLLEIRAGSIKRILKWNGFDIGVELEPGDIRFKGTDHERKMNNGYGHIRNHVGEDGEALDVYLHPDILKEEVGGTDLIFEVNQLRPEDDVPRADWETDEYKYMIGYKDQDAAEAAYLSDMPSKYFGGSKKVSFADLEKYRKKPAVAV